MGDLTPHHSSAWLPGLTGLVVSGLLVGGTFTAVVALSMSVFFKIVVTVYMLSRLLHWQLFFRVQCRRTNRLAVPDGPCAPA